MLAEGELHSDICKKVGVSERTVRRIKKALSVAGQVTDKKRSRVRVLVICGLTESAISSKLKIPVEAVRSVKRADFLLAATADSLCKCPTCGNAILPEGEGEEHEMRRPPNHMTIQHAQRLFSLADEMVGLAKLTTVSNFMFYSIAERAEGLTAAISGEKHATKEKA